MPANMLRLEKLRCVGCCDMSYSRYVGTVDVETKAMWRRQGNDNLQARAAAAVRVMVAFKISAPEAGGNQAASVAGQSLLALRFAAC
jgi:hypothetical protein